MLNEKKNSKGRGFFRPGNTLKCILFGIQFLVYFPLVGENHTLYEILFTSAYCSLPS